MGFGPVLSRRRPRADRGVEAMISAAPFARVRAVNAINGLGRRVLSIVVNRRPDRRRLTTIRKKNVNESTMRVKICAKCTHG
jgi:hypothetical protein